MPDRLAMTIVTGAGWTARETQEVAREAEAAGFDAIFVPEVNNSALADAQLLGQATDTIQIGTWIANINLRHSYVCAQSAALIGELTGGRFILGLGVSHQPINAALGIEMPDPLGQLRQYVIEVQGWLCGDGPPTHLPQSPAPERVPVYVATLGSRAVELGAELADGIMPFLWSAERTRQAQRWIKRGRARASEQRPFEVTTAIPVFVGEDLEALRETARQNLVLYTALPFFQRLFRLMGFPEEADKMEAGNGYEGLSDPLLDAICLIGPVERCDDQLAAFRDAGVDLPILYPPIGVDGAREVIAAFGR